ncbi:phosphatase PAP2 family protein [Chloroflexia bacterium SDU3-3]|nr:phosphatase PAP2 family protein [Chloroflexia bacterium SDU3-3]
MAQQPHMSSELLADDRASRSYAFGLLLSRIFHPVPLAIFMFLVVGIYAADSASSGIVWAIVCVLTMILPTTIFFAVRLRQGVYSDEDVSQRHQRTELYVVSISTMVLGTGVLAYLGLPRPFLALLASSLLIGLLAFGINMFWKISVHAGSVASAATVATLYSGGLGLALWLCALAVGWARVRTGNHTVMQVTMGMLLALSVITLVFRLMA